MVSQLSKVVPLQGEFHNSWFNILADDNCKPILHNAVFKTNKVFMIIIRIKVTALEILATSSFSSVSVHQVVWCSQHKDCYTYCILIILLCSTKFSSTCRSTCRSFWSGGILCQVSSSGSWVESSVKFHVGPALADDHWFLYCQEESKHLSHT